MMNRLAIVAVWGIATAAAAYTPTNWLPEHAASDFQQADSIVVARVIGLNRISSTNAADPTVEFHATFVVGRHIRGPLSAAQRFSFLIGRDSVGAPPEEDRPRYGLLLFGTQQSYWMEINGVYLLCLSRTERGWEPRSGPYSVFRIQQEQPSHDRDSLVVDTRGNKAEARDNAIREVKEASRVRLDDFVRQRMEMGKPNQTPEDTARKLADPQR